jgi:hypothetical protein
MKDWIGVGLLTFVTVLLILNELLEEPMEDKIECECTLCLLNEDETCTNKPDNIRPNSISCPQYIRNK